MNSILKVLYKQKLSNFLQRQRIFYEQNVGLHSLYQQNWSSNDRIKGWQFRKTGHNIEYFFRHKSEEYDGDAQFGLERQDSLRYQGRDPFVRIFFYHSKMIVNPHAPVAQKSADQC